MRELETLSKIMFWNVLERFHGDKCVNYRVLKENIAKTCKHTSKNTGFGGFWKKMQITVQNVVWTVFLGVVVVAVWNSLAWEAPTRGKKEKSTHWDDPKGGGNRGPGRPGLRMAAKLFEIEIQITCTNVKKTNSYVCKLLSPCHGPTKTCGVGGHPTRSGVNTISQ